MSLTNLFAKIAGRHQERQLALFDDYAPRLLETVRTARQPFSIQLSISVLRQRTSDPSRSGAGIFPASERR